MDLTTIAVTLLSARTQSTMMSVAAKMIKDDLGLQKDIAAMLTASSASVNSAAIAASHLGTNLDVTV